MYNFEKIKNASDKELGLFFTKADLAKGRKGKRLRKIANWLLDEVF